VKESKEDVVQKKSIIVRKGKGIICSTRKEDFRTRRGGEVGWKGSGREHMFYFSSVLYLNLEAGRHYVPLPDSTDFRARGHLTWHL
jgi:hypothetical protein